MRPVSRRRFRERARAWLTLANPPEGSELHIYEYPELGEPRFALAGSARFPDNQTFPDMLLVHGDFVCGRRCRFPAPLYVGGDAEIGSGSRIHAVVAEGSLTLAPGVQVDHWAESGGLLDLRSQAAVAGEAISTTSLQVGMNASAGSLSAPEIVSHGRADGIGEPEPVASYLEIAPPSAGRTPDLAGVPGWRPEKMSSLGRETWLYDGHLHLTMPVLLRAKLVVRGSLHCPAGSLVEDDIKTGGSLTLGRGSLVRGNLTSRRDLVLEQGCLFSGDLRAAETLRLCEGARGFRESGPVQLSSGGEILLEPNVVVRGRLFSEQARIGVQPPSAEGFELLLAEC